MRKYEVPSRAARVHLRQLILVPRNAYIHTATGLQCPSAVCRTLALYPTAEFNISGSQQRRWRSAHMTIELYVPDRILFKLAVTVHQCLNGRAPPYPSEHCIPVSSADTRRHLRSANRHLLAVSRFRLNTYGRRAFSVAGPMAWNSLPDFIRDPTSSTDCFRRLLKT